MRKFAIWSMIISGVTFIIAWGIGGVMIFNGEYEHYAWTYVGLACIVVFFVALIILKTKRCPHCGKLNQAFGKFCPHCGKEINQDDK